MSSSPAEKCTDLSEGGAEWRWWRELTGVEGAHRRGGVRLGQLVASYKARRRRGVLAEAARPARELLGMPG